MQPVVESVMKLVLALVLFAGGLGVWLLPKTSLVRSRRIGERLFVATCVVGVLCGATGLVLILVWPRQAIQWHLWEAAATPLALTYMYWMVIMRRAGSTNVVDEKQNLDMTNAGSLAWALSVPVMAVAWILSERGAFDNAVWFPYYLFVTLVLFSGATLYLFKRR